MVLGFGLHVPTVVGVHEFVAMSRLCAIGESSDRRSSIWESRVEAFARHIPHTRCIGLRSAIACISTLRFRPPFFGSGISPDNTSHSLLVRLLGYDGFMALVMLSIISVFSLPTEYRYVSFLTSQTSSEIPSN